MIFDFFSRKDKSTSIDNMQELDSLLEQSNQIKTDIKNLENKLAKINSRIEELKNKKLQQFDSVNVSNTYNSSVTPIIPRPLTIKGYESIRSVLIQHARELFGYKKIFYDYKTNFRDLGYYVGTDNWLLSKIGKELVFLQKFKWSTEEIDKIKSLIQTCEIALRQKQANDLIGYNKYVQVINSNFPIPKSPFTEEKPSDFFQDLESSLYINTYNYLYFMSSYLDVFMEVKKSEPKSQGWVPIPEGINVNEYFLQTLRMFYDLAMNGMSIAIIPICDENIMYRSLRAARENDYLSLYFYNNYVEDPKMVDIPKKLELIEEPTSSEQESVYKIEESNSTRTTTVNNNEISQSSGSTSTGSYQSYYAGGYGGSCWVSSHYRKGYWRNGYYVSGGYVRGHYRR